MRKFVKPVLILWGAKDTNFGQPIATRLAKDIPGVVGVQWMNNSAHLPMLEEPAAYTEYARQFFADGTAGEGAVAALAQARAHEH